jgi:DNA-directed RNA polymerase specialized sigma24 family protein
MSRTDQDLLARLRSDPAAFGEFYLRHVGKVVAAVTRRVDDPAEVRDLVAAAFTRAFGRPWASTRHGPARSPGCSA